MFGALFLFVSLFARIKLQNQSEKMLINIKVVNCRFKAGRKQSHMLWTETFVGSEKKKKAELARKSNTD